MGARAWGLKLINMPLVKAMKVYQQERWLSLARRTATTQAWRLCAGSWRAWYHQLERRTVPHPDHCGAPRRPFHAQRHLSGEWHEGDSDLLYSEAVCTAGGRRGTIPCHAGYGAFQSVLLLHNVRHHQLAATTARERS